MHFLGIKWDNQQKNPWIKYKNSLRDVEESYLPIINGNNLTITIGTRRYCIGSFTHPEYKKDSCKTSDNVMLDSSQCSSCQSKDATYFLPINSLRYHQVKILKEQPHLNYINIFGNNIIKIGVAAKVRKITRLLEQGAVATIFFAESDGFTSRLIESHISKALNIKQAVSWGTKLRFIQEIPEKEKAYAELRKVYEQVIVNISSTYENVLIKNPEFLYNYDYYFLSVPKSINSIKLINQFSDSDIISGLVIGVYGEIVLLKQKTDDIYALNTKSLQGFLIEKAEGVLSTKITHEPKPIELNRMQCENLTLF